MQEEGGHAMRAERPDVTFRLDATARGTIAPSFDADALERLLQNVRPPFRAALLKTFQVETEKSEGLPSDGSFPDVSMLRAFSDPMLNDHLADVWAPFWNSLPDEALRSADMDAYPGRERALARREAHRRDGGTKRR